MYSIAAVGTSKRSTTSSFLNDTKATRTNYRCTGIVCCQYLDQRIKDLSHTEVTSSILESIKQIRIENGGGDRDVDANRFVIHFECISNILLII
jgi:hypothetical protein